MIDRLISRSLWLLVLSMMTAAAAASILMLYRGLFELVIGHWAAAGVRFGALIPFAIAARQLILHKDELMDR